MPRAAEGEFALVREHLDQAIRVANDPVRWGSAVTDLDYNVLCADAAARMRDIEGLRRYVPPAEQGATDLGHRLYRAMAMRARGVQAHLEGQIAQAVRCHSEALSAFEDLATRYQAGLTLGERARAYADLGDGTAARADWQQAAEMFEAQGARPAARHARDELQALDSAL